MNYLRWWLVAACCEALVFVCTLPSLAFMALVRATRRGADRAELELELAGAAARTRRDRKTHRIQSWKKPL